MHRTHERRVSPFEALSEHARAFSGDNRTAFSENSDEDVKSIVEYLQTKSKERKVSPSKRATNSKEVRMI